MLAERLTQATDAPTDVLSASVMGPCSCAMSQPAENASENRGSREGATGWRPLVWGSLTEV